MNLTVFCDGPERCRMGREGKRGMGEGEGGGEGGRV